MTDAEQQIRVSFLQLPGGEEDTEVSLAEDVLELTSVDEDVPWGGAEGRH